MKQFLIFKIHYNKLSVSNKIYFITYILEYLNKTKIINFNKFNYPKIKDTIKILYYFSDNFMLNSLFEKFNNLNKNNKIKFLLKELKKFNNTSYQNIIKFKFIKDNTSFKDFSNDIKNYLLTSK